MRGLIRASAPLPEDYNQEELGEIRKLINAATLFTSASAARLFENVREGKRGWDDPANLPGQVASCKEDASLLWLALCAPKTCSRLTGDKEAADPHLLCLDIANRAMFIWRQLENAKASRAAGKEGE
jgi:hypothetical protein